MLAVLKKELLSYFNCLSGYVFLTFFIFISALYFSFINIFQALPDYQYVISNTTIMFLIIIPLLTMKLYSEEAKNKTDQLLFTAPVSITKITLGKYFAAVILFFFALTLTTIFPIVLSFYASLPFAQIFGTYLGYFLLGACFISVGIFISALSENQIAVSISTFAIIFLFYVLDSFALNLPTGKISSAIFILFLIILLSYLIYNRTKNFFVPLICFVIGLLSLIVAYFFDLNIFDSAIYKILSWFSLLSHFNNFGNGILNLSDIVYYVSFVILFLFLTVNTIEKRRW